MKMKRTKRINWSKKLKNLGVDMDVTIAQRLGVPPTAVRKKRQELGISPAPKAHVGTSVDWRKERKILGVVPDSVIAKRMGVSCEYVRLVREKLGIPRPHDAHQPTERVIDPDKKRQELER